MDHSKVSIGSIILLAIGSGIVVSNALFENIISAGDFPVVVWGVVL